VSTAAIARRRTRAQVRRRRRLLMIVLTAAAAAIVVPMVLSPWADKAVQELQLPLRHEDIIRQQAADKQLDPTLIAGVIYAESHFRDQTSHAGAKGLMQLMPATADYIAHKTGGTQFEQRDLATPQINIAYGSWYLRYLLDRYDGNDVLALAAYNAGEGKVDEWLRAATDRGEEFDAAAHIPFAETRAYVTKVLGAREDYRREYARELGL
jgi:soluble lytic murein transglycosylase